MDVRQPIGWYFILLRFQAFYQARLCLRAKITFQHFRSGEFCKLNALDTAATDVASGQQTSTMEPAEAESAVGTAPETDAPSGAIGRV